MCFTDEGGAILWSKEFTPSVQNARVIQRVIKSTFLEERTATARVDMDGYTVRWAMSNELELIFFVRRAHLRAGRVPAHSPTNVCGATFAHRAGAVHAAVVQYAEEPHYIFGAT